MAGEFLPRLSFGKTLRFDSLMTIFTIIKRMKTPEEKFSAYVRDYDPANPQIALKIKHTFFVVDAADEIGKSLNLDERLSKMLHLAALYHDIGRFEQVRRYGTFYDAKSINHAKLSAEIVSDGDFLEELSEEDRHKVITAIARHNMYALPEESDPEQELLDKALRDADKADIFRVAVEEDPEAVNGFGMEELQDASVSPAVLESLENFKSVKREERQTPLDVWVSFLGFLPDVNYPASFARIARQGYWKQSLEKLLEHEELNETIRQQLQHLLDLYEGYVREHGGKDAK